MPPSVSINISITLEDKIAFLKNPHIYPEKPKQIKAIETHMSWVFFTDKFVYKLKKPVKSDSLDYSTLTKREINCYTEVTLNKKLAPNIYLGVIPITVGIDGKLELQGDGDVVDWLVKMRRLPIECMLDYMIQSDSVKNTDVVNFTRVLSNFYKEANNVSITQSDYCDRFKERILIIRNELLSPQYQLSKDLINSVVNNLLNFVLKHSDCLAQRAKNKKIVEAHGDLRPEHICLLKEPVIIDCLEFSRELRILDPVDELSFLALECERLGSPFIGNLVMKTYSKTANDYPPEKLIIFYKSYRACVRAMVAIWHLKDEQVRDSDKWIQRSNSYLKLAEKYANKLKLKE